jgi:hypothetical protein
VLRKLDDAGVADPRYASVIQFHAARALASLDATRSEAAAAAIAEPTLSGMALVHLVDALPDAQAERKLAVLDRALAQAKLAPAGISRLSRIAALAVRFSDLGEKERARKLLAGVAPDANHAAAKYSSARAGYAVALAPFDLKTALDIANQFPDIGPWTRSTVLGRMAFQLARDNPAEAERVLKQVPEGLEREWFVPRTVWRMAAADPARARALTDESQRYLNNPQAYLFLAAGLSSRDRVAAIQAFQTAMQAIDRLMEDESLMPGPSEVLLPLVEQIDPALVPEYFWRVVAMRPSIGNPRSVDHSSAALLTLLLAWYDREVAAALFEPVRVWMEHADDRGSLLTGFEAWSIVDPRAAVARLERMPIGRNFELDADRARATVAETLALSHEARWRSIWYGYTEMYSIYDRYMR